MSARRQIVVRLASLLATAGALIGLAIMDQGTARMAWAGAATFFFLVGGVCSYLLQARFVQPGKPARGWQAAGIFAVSTLAAARTPRGWGTVVIVTTIMGVLVGGALRSNERFYGRSLFGDG
jgi:hypothetical protein